MAESSSHVHFWLSSFHDKYGVINDRHFLWECCRSWTNFIHLSLALQVSYEDILFSLFSMYQLSHLSLRNALCISMAICISTMSCCVLRSLPFSNTCEKVFEMSLSKRFNIHSMFANVRYKFYCPKQLGYTSWKPFEASMEKFQSVYQGTYLQCCEYLLSTILTWLPSGFHFSWIFRQGVKTSITRKGWSWLGKYIHWTMLLLESQ